MTSIAEAIHRWEEENGSSAQEAESIGLQFQWPPIEKMDENLSTLVNCQMLSLSTNCIDKVTGLQGMNNLKILSLARNNISSLAGLEAVGETLEELWMSYNSLTHLEGLEDLPKLKVLYLAHNRISSWTEVDRIASHGSVKELLFMGNPLVEELEEKEYFSVMKERLPNIERLEGALTGEIKEIEEIEETN